MDLRWSTPRRPPLGVSGEKMSSWGRLLIWRVEGNALDGDHRYFNSASTRRPRRTSTRRPRRTSTVGRMSNPFDLAASDAERLGPHDIAIVMGSGWGVAADALGEAERELPFAALEGLPTPKVVGHGGAIRTLEIAGQRVALFLGRIHRYEGHPVETCVHGVRAAVLAGCSTVILTNAAGGLRPEHGHLPGTAVLISDQLNLSGANPMCDIEVPDSVPGRFVDLSDLYSARLRSALRDAELGLGEGVYAGVLGGSYETPAEIHMLRGMGADLVGMSTVLESIAARHLGAEVLGISLVTNLAAGLSAAALDHREVVAAGEQAGPRLGALLRRSVEIVAEASR